jgi:hypothetical protein
MRLCKGHWGGRGQHWHLGHYHHHHHHHDDDGDNNDNKNNHYHNNTTRPHSVTRTGAVLLQKLSTLWPPKAT